MAKTIKAGTKARKPVAKKPVRKKAAVKKKIVKKKAPEKSVKKTKKKTVKKTVREKTALKRSNVSMETFMKKPIEIIPGPPAGNIPPVEEPAAHEEAVGVVTHYYSHLGVTVVQINKGALRTGDTIHFKGHSTDFTQQVESMEYEHQHVDQAAAGQSIGLKVTDHTREHDIVYRVKQHP